MLLTERMVLKALVAVLLVVAAAAAVDVMAEVAVAAVVPV